MTRALILFTSLLLFTACSRASDVEVRKNLPGVWHDVTLSPKANLKSSVFTFAPSGDFTNQMTSSNGELVVEMAGTFQVQNGYLVGTITQSSQNGIHLPYVIRAKIYQANDSEMVMVYDNSTNHFTLKKETK